MYDQLVSYFLQYDLFHISLAFDHVISLRMCYCSFVIDSWQKAIDACKCVVAGFLNLAKVFDCVNHDIPLDMLVHHGVVDGAHAWLESCCVIASTQLSLMIHCLLEVLLKLVYCKDQYRGIYCSLFRRSCMNQNVYQSE